jgi:hypothetical protein
MPTIGFCPLRDEMSSGRAAQPGVAGDRRTGDRRIGADIRTRAVDVDAVRAHRIVRGRRTLRMT